MRVRISSLALIAIVTCVVSAPALSGEICHELQGGQFADERLCVTSVRAPEGSTNFGPEHLLGTDDGAWCSGAEGNQVVTTYMKPAQLMRTINITNGYAKLAETFRQNGRVKRAMLEADNGYKLMITLKDAPVWQKVIIEKGRYAWFRLRILEITRGTATAGVCLSVFVANLEELNSN